MMNRAILSLVLLFVAVSAHARTLDDLRQALEQSSVSQVQEKVYVHTDNTCYFVGDTLWYKAYVVRSDNHRPTDMSRILYVELLSPDGLLVERQNIIVSATGHTCGQFVLRDSLYSGYYELRAYTRWMLNFNVSHHDYRTDETWYFYNKQMAADYYRQWDGLFSRAIPVYGKPDEPGDYDARRMYQRPKTRLPKPKKDELQATFYPEGGHLVEGVENRVAFELHDQNGEAVQVRGTLAADAAAVPLVPQHMGRGVFTVTPGSRRLKATFTWRGKDYTFSLPKQESQGVALSLDGAVATLRARGLASSQQYALAVLTRGVLRHFQPLQFSAAGAAIVTLPLDSLATGVSDLVVFDADGRILADRLFFVNHHDADQHQIVTPVAATETFSPYQRVEVPVQLPGVTEPTVFSLSVRDTRTDEPSYDDGNLMTSLLLSSELRGFIARPAWYFEGDDEERRQALDCLMMVQGWRRYKFQELADTTFRPRYEPETTMTVSGTVYRMLGIAEVEQSEIPNWQNGVGRVGSKSSFLDEEESGETTDGETTETVDTPDITATVDDNIEYGSLNDANAELGTDHSNLRRDVLIEAEVIMGDEIATAVQKTDHGRFLFQIPPFYGVTYLNLKAYKEKDSVRKAMASRQDVTTFREDAYPDYYVKRDMPYPVFTHRYNFYENHAPDYDPSMVLDTLSELSMENDVHQLQNVNVKGRRRGRRAVDWAKPAFVRDAYDLYNDVTDYGLSFGKFDMRQFPAQVSRFLYGNMGRPNMYNIDGRLEGQTYWRNYSDIIDMGPLSGLSAELQEAAKHLNNRAPAAIYKNLFLSRLQNIRVFSDYEPRLEDSTMVESEYAADVTVEMYNIPDDGKQVVYRDRHIYFHGFNMPEVFYQPDYGSRPVGTLPADYRRTLYWNPNAVTDAEGRFTAAFYNNGKETRVKISAAGVTPDGRLMFSK